jgi:hypothetical protein
VSVFRPSAASVASEPVAAWERGTEDDVNLIDLLLPRTDGGVAVQVVIVVVAAISGLYVTRRRPDARLLVIGVALLAVAFMALRAVH